MFIFIKYIPLVDLDSGFSLTHMALNCFLYCMSRQLQVLYTTSLRHIEGRFCDILSYVMWLFYLRYKVSEICLFILIAIVLRSHLLRCAAEVNEPTRKYIAAFKFAFFPRNIPSGIWSWKLQEALLCSFSEPSTYRSTKEQLLWKFLETLTDKFLFKKICKLNYYNTILASSCRWSMWLYYDCFKTEV